MKETRGRLRSTISTTKFHRQDHDAMALVILTWCRNALKNLKLILTQLMLLYIYVHIFSYLLPWNACVCCSCDNNIRIINVHTLTKWCHLGFIAVDSTTSPLFLLNNFLQLSLEKSFELVSWFFLFVLRILGNMPLYIHKQQTN